MAVTAKAKKAADNVLRSPDGKPFGVRVHVVDISEATNLSKSFYISAAGNGRLLTAAATNADAFLTVLVSAFEVKSKKVCGGS